MSLVNSEYPIDEHFNYQDYLKNAEIPASYENYVKEIATNFYNENKKITLSKIVLFFRFIYSKITFPQNSSLQVTSISLFKFPVKNPPPFLKNLNFTK